MMCSTTKGPVLLVLAVLAILISFLLQGTTQAGRLFDSPPPGQPGPCLSLTQDGYTLEFIGYTDHDDGSTSLIFRLVNDNPKDVSFIAFGTNSWTRLLPADGSIVTGDLGDYRVEWTNEHGVPGFASIKFEAQFDGLSRGKADSFSFTVSEFESTTPISVQVKAGKNIITFVAPLKSKVCDLTPDPTPTPAPSMTPTGTPPRVTPTSTPPSIEAEPLVEVYVLTDAMFEQELSAEEREVRLRQGVPVPAALQIDDLDESRSIDTRTLHAQGLNSAGGWDDFFYDTSFEENIFVDGGACYWRNYVPDQWYWWERDTYRPRSGSYAMWPAAGPYPGAPNHIYPNNLTAQLICELSGMADFENVLVDFWMWSDLADAGDQIGVFFSTDGTYFRGIAWSGPRYQDWTQYRVYYPGLDNVNDDKVYIMWQFVSDDSGTAQGVWLDDLKIRRYNRPLVD